VNRNGIAPNDNVLATNPDAFYAPVSSDILENSLETGVNFVSVMAGTNDNLPNPSVGNPTERTAGSSNGSASWDVVDPTQVTGNDYQITFFVDEEEGSPTEGETYWRLTDVTTGQVRLDKQFNQGGGTDVPVVDGIMARVSGPPFDFAPGDGSGGGIIEAANPNGDPCGSGAGSTGGCDGLGNRVWLSISSDGDYYCSSGNGTLDHLKRYITAAVPEDYEIRFTEAGGWGVFAFTDDKICTVPFEIWNIGPGTVDDPSDDRRMIPFINDNDGTGNTWGWGTGEEANFGAPMSDWIYWMEPEDLSPGTTSYDAFAAACVAAGGAGATYPSATDGSTYGYFADFEYKGAGGFVYPIGRLTFCDWSGDGTPPATGVVVRLLTTKPNSPADVFSFSTAEAAGGDPVALEKANFQNASVFPNPYKAYSALENTGTDAQFVTFTNLPTKAKVRVYTLSGRLVRTLEKDDATTFLTWDLQNEAELRVASGLYIVHIEAPDLGEQKVLKLAVMQREDSLQYF
jgi:hypothetical protein